MKRYGILIIVLMLVPLLLGSSPGCNPLPSTPTSRTYVPPPIWVNNYITFNADGRVYVVPEDGSRLDVYSSDEGYALASSVSEDGIVAFTASKAYKWFEGRKSGIEIVSLDGSDRRIFSEQRYASVGDDYPVWSPDGSLIAFQGHFPDAPGRYSPIAIMDREANLASLIPLDSTTRGSGNPPAWSPDGKRIAFSTDSIYVTDIHDGEPIAIGPASSMPAWSPDGSRIAFLQNEEDSLTGEIKEVTFYTVRSDGSDRREIASIIALLPSGSTKTNSDNYIFDTPLPLSWSRDGSEIRIQNNPFVVVKADGSGVRVMDVQGGERTVCHAGVGEYCPFRTAQAVWSPDDSRIAVLLHDSPTGVRLFTMKPDGSDKRVLVRWDEATNHGWEAVPWRPGLDDYTWEQVER